MSRASRLALADTRIERPRDEVTGQFRKRADLARNGAGVPGGLGFDLPAPVVVCEIEWLPADGDPVGFTDRRRVGCRVGGARPELTPAPPS